MSGLRSDDGQALIGVFASEENWLKDTVVGKKLEIENGTCSWTFEGIPFGFYGISVIHDENGNGKMDTSMFRIPREPYGCSNGAKGKFGPPKWKDARFEVNGEVVSITIVMEQ